MATQKTSSLIAKKMMEISDTYTVHMYDNGFMIEMTGRDKRGEYTNAKIICNSVEEVLQISKEICTMERHL